MSVLVNQGPSEPVVLAAQMIDVLTQETSVEEQAQHEVITITPNPACNNVTITCPGDVHLMQLYDIHGCMVYEVAKPSAESSIDISNLASGLYAVSAHGLDGLVRRAVFVK
jgi:hypothetical protein